MENQDQKQKKPGEIQAEEKLRKWMEEIGQKEEKQEENIEHE